MLLLFRHHSSPAPEYKAFIPLPGRRNSTRPSKSAWQVCHVPRYWRTRAILATCTGHRRLHFRHECCAAAMCPQSLAATSILLQEAQPGIAKIQRIRSGAAGCLGGREEFPPHAGSALLHHLHRS
jgi:hypothetical protein